MASRTFTVAFEGAEARLVDVQVQLAGGAQPVFSVVGLGDKTVAESRERVRAAFSALGLSMPSRRLIVNLAPADRPKEGSHFDLPIAIAILAELGVVPKEMAEEHLAFGELGVDASINPTPGALPAAMAASSAGRALICPEASGPEAAWAGGHLAILAPATIIQLINHFKGTQLLARPVPGELLDAADQPDLRQVKGQESAKRALEIAAAGGHNLLMVGPPGSGKSMMAERLPGLLPPLAADELLDVSMIHSVAGLIERGSLTRHRPFRSPHHSASMAAMVGGGTKARPGEASLAHRGVLFLDELPEFHPQVLDSLRQPLETGSITVARANAHVNYPARFQLIAAMNPCRCGGGGQDGVACKRGPRCAIDYQARISGPMLDRIDLQITVPPVTPADLALPAPREGTTEAAARVLAARSAQLERGFLNAQLPTDRLDHVAEPDRGGQELLNQAAAMQGLTARSYHRVLRVARTVADLDGCEPVRRVHIAEALACRRALANAATAKA
ncbi:MAG: YifB family Mg chelatase-like AAA ATPase [Maricaulis sp.]|uniref:YifB family Mg chelatase-like AAA ATPase n=1 Tax=Maricaulis sp. TaxID=1486257 RepID=UPI00263814A7|nr:YifB family Mg chelatase-like AAA ATPase [Maricaulis sp.]MDM7984968.1 YifB family Mg chelatase-like AAA ATPase [Maricaulis sp.]